MKKIPKAKSWEETLQLLRAQLCTLDGSDKEVAEKRIASLEKAIAIRDSLESPERISFSP